MAATPRDADDGRNPGTEIEPAGDAAADCGHWARPDARDEFTCPITRQLMPAGHRRRRPHGDRQAIETWLLTHDRPRAARLVFSVLVPNHNPKTRGRPGGGRRRPTRNVKKKLSGTRARKRPVLPLKCLGPANPRARADLRGAVDGQLVVDGGRHDTTLFMVRRRDSQSKAFASARRRFLCERSEERAGTSRDCGRACFTTWRGLVGKHSWVVAVDSNLPHLNCVQPEGCRCNTRPRRWDRGRDLGKRRRDRLFP